jgi:hypothetical protein
MIRYMHCGNKKELFKKGEMQVSGSSGTILKMIQHQT